MIEILLIAFGTGVMLRALLDVIYNIMYGGVQF